jgi:hypothetical protein
VTLPLTKEQREDIKDNPDGDSKVAQALRKCRPLRGEEKSAPPAPEPS